MLLSASTAVFANSGSDNLWSYGHPDFKVDSISYRITSDSTCEVTFDSLYVAVNGHAYGMIHKAEISIPAKVINDGKAYAVTGIEKWLLVVAATPGESAFRRQLNISLLMHSKILPSTASHCQARLTVYILGQFQICPS